MPRPKNPEQLRHRGLSFRPDERAEVTRCEATTGVRGYLSTACVCHHPQIFRCDSLKPYGTRENVFGGTTSTFEFEQTNNRTKFCESNFGFANCDPTPKCPAATSPPSRGQMGRSQGKTGEGVHHAPKRSTNENCRHADNYSNTKSLARAMPIRMCPQILGTKCEAVILASLESNRSFPCRESDSCETHHYRAKATIATSLRLVL